MHERGRLLGEVFGSRSAYDKLKVVPAARRSVGAAVGYNVIAWEGAAVG